MRRKDKAMLTEDVNGTREFNDAQNMTSLFLPKLGNDTAAYIVLAALSTLLTPRLFRIIDKLIDWLKKYDHDKLADTIIQETAVLSDLQINVLFSLTSIKDPIPRDTMFFAKDMYGHLENVMYSDRLSIVAKWNVFDAAYNIASIQAEYEDPEIKIEERSASIDIPEFIPVTFDRLFSYLESVRQDSFDWVAQIDEYDTDNELYDDLEEEDDDYDNSDNDAVEDLKDKIRAIGTSVDHIIKELDILPRDLKERLLLP